MHPCEHARVHAPNLLPRARDDPHDLLALPPHVGSGARAIFPERDRAPARAFVGRRSARKLRGRRSATARRAACRTAPGRARVPLPPRLRMGGSGLYSREAKPKGGARTCARARACARMGSAAPCAHWSIGHPKQPLADGTLLLRDRSMMGRTCTRCARATTQLHCVLVALAFLAVSLITATAPTAALPAHADAGRADELVPRPRAALVYLISAKPRHCRLLAQSLRHLQANFNGLPTRQYPVVVFHDGLDGATETFVRDAARTAGVADLRLERAEHFIVPRNVDRGRMLRHIKEGPPVLMRSEGYRTMIRWWSGPVLRESALAAFEYAWRFDTDSFLLRPLAYDPLRDMARRGAKYGYRAVCPEAPQVGKGLSEVVDRWATRELGFAPDARPRTLADPQTISSTAPNGSGRVVDRWRLAGGGVYYTNFEILELGFFRARVLFPVRGMRR